MKNILITGSEGFIGKNLVIKLNKFPNISITSFNRGMDISMLDDFLQQADYVFHLAGENRTNDISAFAKNNEEFTSILCEKIKSKVNASDKKVKLIFTSSIQASLPNPYGQSKLEAEEIIKNFSNKKNFLANIFRLPGVFGKWCRPNYNSVVSTFCYNIAREIPVRVDDENRLLNLVYIDDVINNLILSLNKDIDNEEIYKKIEPEYSITLGELATQINNFKLSREDLRMDANGSGFLKALYSTYLSYLPTNQFSYKLNSSIDPRGKFVEVLKSSTFGQISYLTINSNQERGGHYHHTKTEKFLVLKGNALFRFKNIITKEFIEIKVSSKETRIVDTIPGWIHDIVNIGSEEVVIMLWSNEIYDPNNPDTIQHKVL